MWLRVTGQELALHAILALEEEENEEEGVEEGLLRAKLRMRI
jgi:hypothetical protein